MTAEVRELRHPLTCPYCGDHDNASEVNHPGGRYFCACGSCFNGDDDEWRRLAPHRAQVKRRLERTGEAS